MTAPTCPLCDEDGLQVFVERQSVPVHQNLLLRTAREARAMARGDLRIAHCAACGFVTNLAFDGSLLSYGGAYENDQTCSPFFDRYVDELVHELVRGGLVGKTLVEVGCGNGYFLRKLCREGDNRGLGFDPAYEGPESRDAGRVTFVRELYRGQQGTDDADAVISRHVIEHVPRPLDLLRSIRSALGTSSRAKLFFETPAVDWILRHNVVWDFFYEHCSYFTSDSLRTACRRAGLAPVAARRLFNDQYLWLEAHATTPRETSTSPSDLGPLIEVYRGQESRTFDRFRELLDELGREGPVAVWGAGAKGVTFLNLFDPDVRSVNCVVDVNPRKQGHFLPGTGHPIVAAPELARRSIRNVVIMNPNYLGEIGSLVASVAPGARLHAAE